MWHFDVDIEILKILLAEAQKNFEFDTTKWRNVSFTENIKIICSEK